jgi:hypothetical protein
MKSEVKGTATSKRLGTVLEECRYRVFVFRDKYVAELQCVGNANAINRPTANVTDSCQTK